MKNNKLGFGCMRLPLKEADDSSSIDMQAFKSMADSFMQEGFTYFDTAYPYHARTSETAIREAVVKRHKRDTFTIATKMPMWELQTCEDTIGYSANSLQNAVLTILTITCCTT